MKKGQGPFRTLPLIGASSCMGSVMTANRQSGVSVIVVHGHRLGSFTEDKDSVASKFCSGFIDQSITGTRTKDIKHKAAHKC